ncbi:MAG: Imm1 family immunity protein [Pseudomonas sp.]|uniref:Imm1 family immunity protein n=1 Tax=Pseudomonas sp. TaxID=306 RepID=UPI003398F033
MIQRTLCEDHWDGVGLRPFEHPAWTPDGAKAALERLDGQRLTQLLLTVGEDRLMLIGGGGNRFSVSICFDVDRELYTLVDPAKADTVTEDLLIGGQLGCFPANQIVAQDRVLAAIEHFHREGAASPGLTWLRE